ncbi:conjugal transfer protein [Streptomyces sp. NPDC001268]|uniref:conjugal transfer protein n=1 Tax=Streptomyces sp. NPDC001268 TaxID=3364553 RepID=UPI00367BB5D3
MPSRSSRPAATRAGGRSRPLRESDDSVRPLQAAHRRVSIARLGVWAALAAGPVALAVACAVPRSSAPAQPLAATAADLRTSDPAGVATLFCELWLRSDTDSADASTARALRVFAPNVDLPDLSGRTAAQELQRAVAVRSARLAGETWSVVVAAQFTVPDRGAKSAPAAVVRYFAVPVTASSSAAGVGEFTVTAAPAEVAGPTTAKAQPPAMADVLPSNGAVTATLGEFFRAYLLGVGEVDRYLSPGTSLTAARGGGYTSVTVDRVAADTDRAGGLVPADGSTARVEARVTATDAAGGRWPMAYSLALTSRSGRWEVTALRAGADSQKPTATSSTTPAEKGEPR